MQFLVTAYDHSDEQAWDRRLVARVEHLEKAGEMHAQGHLLYAAAILDDEGKMVGSMLVVDFESRDELDEWLKGEPYVTGRVWEKIDVKRCQIAPFCV